VQSRKANTHRRRRRDCRVESRRRCKRTRRQTKKIDDDDDVTHFTISCAVELLRLVTSDDIVTSLLKKLSISIKIHVVKRYEVCLVSFQIVDRTRRQSS